MAPIGKSLVFAGIAILLLGVALLPHAGLKLPGDIQIRHGNFTFYFPIVTCILISIVATIFFSLMRH